jgi:hypothetical protein
MWLTSSVLSRCKMYVRLLLCGLKMLYACVEHKHLKNKIQNTSLNTSKVNAYMYTLALCVLFVNYTKLGLLWMPSTQLFLYYLLFAIVPLLGHVSVLLNHHQEIYIQFHENCYAHNGFVVFGSIDFFYYMKLTNNLDLNNLGQNTNKFS